MGLEGSFGINSPQKEEKKLAPTGAPLEEYQFYQDRFAGMAKRHNSRRSVVDRLTDKTLKNDKSVRPKKINKGYVMEEQAWRENRDRDRILDKERREWDEMLKPVIEILKQKRENTVESKRHKVIIYALGAGMRGPYGAAQTRGLEEIGVTAEKVEVLVGASAGMADLIYYASGQVALGTANYYDECTSEEFIDLSRVKQVLNVSVIGRSMRAGEKAVDRKRVNDIPTEVYALTTPVNSTKAELVDVKTAKPGMIDAVEASMNVRLLRAPAIDVNGIQMEDGSFGSFEIQQLIDRFQEPGKDLTILVLPNIPFQKLSEVPETSQTIKKLPNTGILGTIKKFAKVSGELRKTMQDCKKAQGVNIGIMWPPDRGLDILDVDPDQIKLAVVDTIRDTIKQFGETQPKEIKLYVPEKERQKAAT